MQRTIIDTIDADDIIEVVANGNISANTLVAVYKDDSGVMTAIPVAIDGNTGLGYKNIANAFEAIASGETGHVNMQGVFTVLSGGTEDELVTEVSLAGEITSTAVGATTADITTVYGTVISDGVFLKKKPIS